MPARMRDVRDQYLPPTTKRSSGPSRRRDASSSSRRRARRARRSSSPSASTSRRTSRSTTARACASWRAPRRASASSPARARERRSRSARSPKRSSAPTELSVGVVNREREATPETPSVERHHRHDRHRAPLVPGRRHPAAATRSSSTRSTRRRPSWSCASRSGKRVGCRFIWLSATVDPDVLRAVSRLRRRARGLRVRSGEGGEGERRAQGRRSSFSTTSSCSASYKEKRGVALFVPTRAAWSRRRSTCGCAAPRINTAFYHGGEPIRIIRPFLEGERAEAVLPRDDGGGPERAQRAAGSTRSIIDDTRFNVIDRARQERAHQAAPRRQRDSADGGTRARARRGRARVHPQRSRHRILRRCKPTEPEFQLAGDSRARRDHVRRSRRARRRARAAGAARPRRVSARDRAARGARHHRERAAHALRHARSKRCRWSARGRSCS